MIQIVGWICFFLSILLDIASYIRQIQKLVKTRCSEDISSTAWYMKWYKDLTAIIACVCLVNYIGAGLATIGLIMCSITLYLIISYKPKDWRKQSMLCSALNGPSLREFWE